MYLDTPATIAILGGGPIGLEAALYARYLGYDVHLYEREQVGRHLRQAGHVRLFTPFGMNASPLGLSALSAQDPAWSPPSGNALLTAAEFVNAYLVPLAQSDLLADCVHEQSEVLFVGKETFRKTQRLASEQRADERFRLLVRDAEGDEQLVLADAVIDATGVLGNPAWLGAGGIPAAGERRLRKAALKQKASERAWEHGLPDILGSARKLYAGKTVLVVGGGHSAATNVLALVQLAEQEGEGRVVWVTPDRDLPEWSDDEHETDDEAAEDEAMDLSRKLLANAEPVRRIANDPLPERDRLAAAANAAIHQACVEHRPGSAISRVKVERDKVSVRLVNLDGSKEDLEVDRVLANVGYRPDRGLYRELQVAECAVSEGLTNAAASLEAKTEPDAPAAQPGPQRLLTGEPHFYILGAKSYGRRSGFLIADGLEQIRDLFKIIGDREGLDLYRTMKRM